MKFTAIALTPAGWQAWQEAARRSPRALDWMSYGRLAMPSQDAPVEYFSSVQPELFDRVVNRYSQPGATGMSGRM